MSDRFGKAIGVGEVKVRGQEMPIRVKVGDIRNYIKAASKLGEDKTGATDMVMDFNEKLLTQGKGSKLEDDELLAIEMDFESITKQITEFCGLGKSDDAKKKIEESKN